MSLLYDNPLASRSSDGLSRRKVFEKDGLRVTVELPPPPPVVDKNLQAVKKFHDACVAFLSTKDGSQSMIPTLEPYIQLRGVEVCGRVDYSTSPPVITKLPMKQRRFAHVSFNGSRFHNVDFSGSSFVHCTFYGAAFVGCNFDRCKFPNCIMTGISLRDNTYEGVDMELLTGLPAEGEEFVAYKKVVVTQGSHLTYGLATLLVPAKAKRVAPIGHTKYRVSEAKVLSIEPLVKDGATGRQKVGKEFVTHYGAVLPKKGREFVSLHRRSFQYKVGKTVKPDRFDPSVEVDCSHGIHILLTKRAACDWNN